MDESKAKGGRARAAALSPERRAEIAKLAADARWIGREWHVYKLCPPVGGEPFYVGCSMNLESTVSRHRNDTASPVCGTPFELIVVSTHNNKRDALRAEGALIDTLPGLLNRQRSHGNTPSPKEPIVGVRIDAELAARFHEACAKRGTTASEVLRRAVVAFVERDMIVQREHEGNITIVADPTPVSHVARPTHTEPRPIGYATDGSPIYRNAARLKTERKK